MTDIAELGFAVDSKPLAQTNEQLDKLPGAANRAQTGVKKLNDEVDRGHGGVSRFMHKIVDIRNELVGGFRSALVQTAAGFGLAFGGAELLRHIGETAEALDRVSKAARVTGSTTQSFQALSTAGQLAGLSTDVLSMSVKRMNKVLGDAIISGKGTKGVFAQLGISAQALAALPVDQRFAKIADRMRELGFSSTDVAGTLAKLGDRTQALGALLGQGGEEIRKASGDVEKFHLAITSLQGANIEEMNDNFTRLGYSLQGAFNQFIAFIAPTMAAIFIGLANGIAFVVENLGKVAPYAGIAGTALLVAFGPVIIEAVLGLAAAIVGGLIGALTTLAAVIMANPLLALATLLAGSIAAIWTFRDAIKQAIGIDVEAIVKGSVNFIVGSFVFAFNAIKDTWSQLPGAIGDLAIQAVNNVLGAVSDMLNGSRAQIVKFLADMAAIPGIGAGFLAGASALAGAGKINMQVANPFAGSANKVGSTLAADQQSAFSVDYVKQLTDAWSAMSTTSKETTTSVANTASAIDGAGGASEAAAAKADHFKNALKAASVAAKAANDKIAELRQTVTDTVGGAFKSFFHDLMQGKSAIDSLTDALGNLADKLMDMVLDNVLSGIVGSLFGGGLAGGLGVAGGALGGLKLANGGVMGGAGISAYSGSVVSTPTVFPFASGVGLMGEAGPEAVMPLGRASNGKLGVINASNDNGGVVMLQPIIYNNASDKVEATTSMGADGNLIVTIDKINAGLVNDRGSRTHKAFKGSFGVQSAVKVR